MIGDRYTWLIIDDGEDGFVELSEKGAVMHSGFNRATRFPDTEEGQRQVKKVIAYCPMAGIFRVVAHIEVL